MLTLKWLPGPRLATRRHYTGAGRRDGRVPLKGRTVSGLHVENNLRIVERFVNARKANKWESLGWERPCASSGDVPLASGDAPPSQLALF